MNRSVAFWTFLFCWLHSCGNAQPPADSPVDVTATRFVNMTRPHDADRQRPPSKLRMRTRGIWVVLTVKSGTGMTLDEVKRIDFRDEDGFVQAPKLLGFFSDNRDPYQAEAIEDLEFYGIDLAPENQVINAVVFEFPAGASGGALTMTPDSAPLLLKWELTKSKMELTREAHLRERVQRPQPNREPTRPVPTPAVTVSDIANLKWIPSETELGMPLGISQSGFYVFPTKEGTELQVFDPGTETFRPVGPAIRGESLIGIAGDRLLIADTQTKDCSVYDLASGERIFRYFLDLKQETPIGIVATRHDDKTVLLAFEKVTEQGNHILRFHPMEVSTGTVSSDSVSGTLQNWHTAKAYDFIATGGFNRILMRNRAQGVTVQVVFSRMMGEYKAEKYPLQGLSLLDDGSLAYANGAREAHQSNNEVSGYAAPARSTHHQIAVTRKGDVCLWDPDHREIVLNFGKLPRFEKKSSRGRPPYSLFDIGFDVRTGILYYAPILNRNGIFFGRPDLFDAVKKAGDPILLVRSDPPPIFPDEPWEFTPGFIGREKGEVKVRVQEKGPLESDGTTLRYRSRTVQGSEVPLSFTASFGGKERRFMLVPAVADLVAGQGPVRRARAGNWEIPHSLIDLDGESERMLIAGGGRYLVCKIPSRKEWVILDLESLQPTGRIPFGTSNGDLLAAGANIAVSYDVTRDLFITFSLPEGNRVSTFANPLDHPVHGMTMGSAQDEAFFVVDRSTEENQDVWQWRILQVTDGTILSSGGRFKGAALLSDATTHWRSTPDMTTVVGKISTNRESARISHIAGGWRGEIFRDQGSTALSVLTGGRIAGASFVYSPAKKELFQFEAQTGRILITREVAGAPLVAGVPEHSLSTFTFYRDDAKEIRFTLRDVPELRSRKVPHPEIQERFHFDYDRNLGVVSPFGSNTLLVFQWNISDLYQAPPEIVLPSEQTVAPGELLDLPLTVLHAAPSVTVALRGEPEGMALREGGGGIRWNVPADFREPVSIDLIVTDGEERRSLHTLTLSPEIPDLLKVVRNETPLDTALLGFSDVAVATAPSSPYSVVGYDGHLCLYDAKNGLLDVREHAVRGNSDPMALRGGSLYLQEQNMLTVLDVPRLERRQTFDVGMGVLTDVEAPENTDLVFFAGAAKNTSSAEKHVVGVLTPEKASSTLLSGVHGTRIGISPGGDAIFSALEHAHSEQMYRYDPYIGIQYPVTVTTHLHEAGSYILNRSESGFRPVKETRISGAPLGLSMNYDFSLAAITHGARDADGNVKVTGISFYNPSTLDKLSIGFQTAGELKGFSAHPYLPLAVLWGETFSSLVTIPDGRFVHRNLQWNRNFASVEEIHWVDRGRKLFVVGTHLNGRRMIQVLTAPLGEDHLALLPQTYGERTATGDVSRRLRSAYIRNNTNRDPKAGEWVLAAGKSLAEASVKRQTPEQIAEEYKRSVVMISSSEGNGTGMVISRTGLILTCDHVLPASNRFTVHLSEKDGKTSRHEGLVVWRDARNDVALIRVEDDREWKPVSFDRGRKLLMGEEVTTIGHPGMGSETLLYTMTKGVISNPERNIKGITYIQTSSPVNPGVSGGPLFDGKGNVIGMVTAKAWNAEAIAFAVPVRQIISIMKEILTESKE